MLSGDFERPPYRPPSEAMSLLLRLVRGCPWNRCTFCSMYKGIPFTVRPLEELLEDLRRARRFYGPSVERVFFGDSDPLFMKTEELNTLLDYLYRLFPGVERVTAYARIKTILQRPLVELTSIARSGLTRLHIGLESGSLEVLKDIKKGPHPQEMIDGTKKAIEAGFEVSLYVLIGAGGVDLTREHIEGTVHVINRGSPDFIRLRTLYPLMGTPLYYRISKGLFHEISPLERLEETHSLVEGIEVETSLYSDHVTNVLRTSSHIIYQGVDGRLPLHREELLEELDRGIELLKENPLLEEEILPPSSL